MEMQAAEKILHEAMHADENIRLNAERTIKSVLQRDFVGFLGTFGQIMLERSFSLKTRHISSILVKNAFYSKNPRIQKGFECNWLRTHESFRNGFISSLQANLNSSEIPILDNTCNILGSIIRMECVNIGSRDLFKKLYVMLGDIRYGIGVMQTISVACNQLYDETSYDFSNDQADLFRIATYYMKNQEPSTRFQETMLECVFSSLDTFGDVFKDESVKKEFLINLSEYARQNEKVIDRALEVLTRFVSVCQNGLKNEIEAIGNFVNSFLDREYEAVHIAIFDFWKLMAELNNDLLLEKNLPILLPRLFSYLAKEDPGVTEMTEHKAGSAMLLVLVEKFGAKILENSISQLFIAEKLQSADARTRAVGAIALGCLCEPGSASFMRQAMECLLNDIGNPESTNEALAAIEKICEKDLFEVINYLTKIIEKCGQLISSGSEFAANAV